MKTRRRMVWSTACVVAALVLPGCSRGDAPIDPYIRYLVEIKRYEIAQERLKSVQQEVLNMQLGVSDVPDDQDEFVKRAEKCQADMDAAEKRLKAVEDILPQ